MCSRHPSMPLALPVTNPSKPMAGGQGTARQIPEGVSAHCAQAETHHMGELAHPCRPTARVGRGNPTTGMSPHL